MAYNIPLPDGRFAQFSDDVEPDVARRQIMTAFPEWFSEEDRQYFERQDIEQETTALGRGFRSAKERTLGNVAALTGYALGDEFAELQRNITQTERAAAEQNPYATTFDEVQQAFGQGFFPGLERLGSYVGESLGASLPYMGGTVVGGAIGTFVGGPVGTVSGAAAPFAGALIGGAPQFVADNVARQVQEGAKSADDIDMLAAVTAGVAQSGLNAAGPLFTGIMGRGLIGPIAQQALIKQTLDKLSKIPGGRFAAAGISASQVEGLTEVLQTGLERMQAGLEPFDDEETLAAYTGGAMLGLIMGGTGAVLTRKKNAAEQFDPDPKEEAVVHAPIPTPPLALPRPETDAPRRPIFDIRPEPDETPQTYAERAIRVAGADFPPGPYTQIQTENGFQIVSESGDYIGQPFATADQAQAVLNVYNERAADIAQAKEIREAIKNTRQQETEALVAAAQETISPIGTFTIAEVGPSIAGRVNARRMQRGLNALEEFSLEELAKAKIPQTQISELIDVRRPATRSEVLQASDVYDAAAAKNLIFDDNNFNIFARRTTGTSDVERMNQTQLRVLRDKINELPVQQQITTIPVVEKPLFTEAQYDKAVSAIQQEGRFTQRLLSAHTNIRDRATLQALRDKMVDRGVLVKRNANDYRLSDVIGGERRTTVADLPEGATQIHTVREIPIGSFILRKNNKSVGRFNSETEARAQIKRIREREAEKGLPQSTLNMEPAEGVGYAVMQNRYDAEGNFLGAAPLDTRKTADEARKEADRLDGRVDVDSDVAPAKKEAPEALQGRVGDVMSAMKKLAEDRALGDLGTRVRLLADEIPGTGKVRAEGAYSAKADEIYITVRDLKPDMTTEQIIEKLSQVMDHELIHSLKRHNVLNPNGEAWKTLERYVRRAERPEGNETYYQFARRNYRDIEGYKEADIMEEAVAEAFRYWAADRRAVAGKPASIFRQIVEYFKELIKRVPNRVFESIETGDAIRKLAIPGDASPRAQSVAAMDQKNTELNLATEEANTASDLAKNDPTQKLALAIDEANSNVKRLQNDMRRLQAQAAEDRRGKIGSPTVLGTTPSKAFATGPRGDATRVRDATNAYRKQTGDMRPPLDIYLEEPDQYFKQLADAHDRASHDPADVGVMRAYSALTNEIKKQFVQFSDLEIRVWSKPGDPYENPAQMYSDIDTGRINWRMSNDMFAGSPRIAGHPMYDASGFKTVEGRDLTYNDLLRFLHEYYGHGQYMFGYTPRDAYNAFHQHARLFSDVARPALAAETLGPMAWQNAGAHMRRANGTVPQLGDVDYLSQARREFAAHKAYTIPDEVLRADPGLEKIREVESPANTEIINLAEAGERTRFSLGKYNNLSLEPWGKDIYGYDLFMITTPDGRIIGQVVIDPNRVDEYLHQIAIDKDNKDVALGDEVLVMEWAGTTKYLPGQRLDEFENRRVDPEAQLGPNQVEPAVMRQMATWLAEHYPSAKWIAGYRVSGSRGSMSEGTSGVPADGYQFMSAEPLRNRLKRRLPGGEEFGKENPTESDFSPADTEKPKFSVVRDGNDKFGGTVADAQLRMARTGENGAFLIYMSPENFLRAAGDQPINPQQRDFNELVSRGYRLNTFPGLAIKGDDGVVNVDVVDGLTRVRALQADGITQVPVMIYPDKKKQAGLITGYQGKGGRLQAFKRAEYMPALRDPAPKYSVKAPLNERVPIETNNGDFLSSQTVADNIIGKTLHKLSTSTSKIPFLGFSIMDARVKLQDSMLPVEKMIQKIKDMGGRVSDFANTYMVQGLMNDRVRHRLTQNRKYLYTPLFHALQRSGITYDELKNYIYALHAPERNAEVRRRGEEEFPGSGMTDEEARAILDGFAKQGKMERLANLEQLVARIRDDTNKTRVAAGLVSAEAIAQSPFKNYVPLRGFVEEDLDPDLESDLQYQARVRRGYSTYGREDPSFAGRKSRAGDVLSNLIQQNIESHLRAGRNEVAQSFLQLMRDNPANQFGRVLERVPMVRKYIPSRDRIQMVPDPNYRNRDDIFIAKENGKDVIMISAELRPELCRYRVGMRIWCCVHCKV